jgi:hypothetical protein
MTALLGVILSTSALPQAAAHGDEAKRHFDAAIALARKHDFAAAIAEFEASYRLHPLPALWLDIALSERALGRWARAGEHLRRYIAESESTGGLTPAERDEVRSLLLAVDGKLAELRVNAAPEAELLVDGQLIGSTSAALKVDPGMHHVEVRARGFAPASADVELAPGERRELALRQAPLPVGAAPPMPERPSAGQPPPLLRAEPPPSRLFASPPLSGSSPRFIDTAQGRAAIGLGSSALGLFIAGAATGGVVLADKSAYHHSCDQVCDAGLYDRARALAVTTDVLFAVGAAGAVTSLVLTLVRPAKYRRAPAARALGLAPGLTLQGVF